MMLTPMTLTAIGSYGFLTRAHPRRQVAHLAADIPNLAASAVVFDAGGKLLAASTTSTSFDVFDDNAGVRTSEKTDQLNDVKFGVLSRDGSELFLAGAGSVGQIWDLKKGRILATIVEPGIFSDGATMFSPDGTRLVTQAKNGTVRLLNARTGAQVALLGTDSVGYGFNEAGDRMITSSQSGEIRIWDVSNGKLLLDLTNAGNLRMSLYGNNAIAWTDEQLQVLDTRLARKIGSIKMEPYSYPQISPDGTHIVIENGATVAVWDAQSVRKISALAGPHRRTYCGPHRPCS